jgi:EAL domain-containing protein (putative c-di-GMP-specific phosphodiesterase class I)
LSNCRRTEHATILVVVWARDIRVLPRIAVDVTAGGPAVQVERLVAESLDRILSTRVIECVFQPVVDLRTGGIVGFEALARGPADEVTPTALFSAAAARGRLPELDWICRAAACRAALAANLPPDLALFVNVEPATGMIPCPPDLADVIRDAVEQLQVVAEVTERSVARDPAALLATVADLREYTSLIALDDVGAEHSSQAMMSLIHPDVIKLDRYVVQRRLEPDVYAIVAAVTAEAERTGAVVLAEGIETVAHFETAMSGGATLGQGWLFGRPGPLPPTFAPSPMVLPQTTPPIRGALTPFQVARRRRPINRVSKQALIALSRHLEHQGVTRAEPAVLLASFQDVHFFGPRIRARYADLAAGAVFTAVYGSGMPTDLGQHMRGCDLPDDDPLVDEWNVIVIGSHFAGGLFAKEVPDIRSNDRSFDLIVSYDRQLILDAARPLIYRLLPHPDP